MFFNQDLNGLNHAIALYLTKDSPQLSFGLPYLFFQESGVGSRERKWCVVSGAR
ncbi:hypothetical protein IQ272_22460 [Chroococcidiopsidales cyanobacterium LEGE 13417]|uniref:hypothetical protein n=1 Tax=Chroococcidiopsis sp. CCALA 051 TaxID=869949 RepID=UPI00130505F1|nr:hypothetical protein [Chroococcidiopsis sp. CCALA 051]MBE9018864.1 hypothetical protein [Chroococcidiopsidales cyanobacterium LEGE 13417]